MTLPPPPNGFQTWQEHITYTVRSNNPLKHVDAGVHQEVPDYEREYYHQEIIKSTVERHLKWLDFLDEWWPELSRRLERSFEDVLYNHILKTDHPDDNIRIQFSDGSELVFKNAFCLGGPLPDGGRDDLHVFSKHCGYHRFVVDADDRISVISAERPLLLN